VYFMSMGWDVHKGFVSCEQRGAGVKKSIFVNVING